MQPGAVGGRNGDSGRGVLGRAGRPPASICDRRWADRVGRRHRGGVSGRERSEGQRRLAGWSGAGGGGRDGVRVFWLWHVWGDCGECTAGFYERARGATVALYRKLAMTVEPQARDVILVEVFTGHEL